MEKLLFNVDPGSIGVMAENEDGVETYLPVLMFNYKITGWGESCVHFSQMGGIYACREGASSGQISSV